MLLSSVMRIGMVSAIIAIALSPRIPLAVVIPGRRFDLRFEDLILIPLLLFWLLYLSLRPRIYLTPLSKVIGIYMFIVIFSTGIAMMTLDLSPIRTFFYVLKEVEYFIIYFFVANWSRSESDIRLASGVILLAGILNAVWVGWQLITSQFHPLFIIRRTLPSAVYENPSLFSSYGPNLLGEASPLSTGGFFLLITLLTLSLMLFSKANDKKRLYLLLSIVFSIGLAVSFSRAAILGAVIGVGALSTQIKLKVKARMVPLTFIMLAAAALIMGRLGFFDAGGRLSFEGISHSFLVRMRDIWQPLLSHGFEQIFLGYGKGALGFAEGLHATEAHNYYLRVFVESGLFGLIAFVWLLVMIIFLCVKVLKESKVAISKVIACATLSATVGLGVAAMLQDVFTPVILNEYWWVLVGLTAAAYRIEFGRFHPTVEVVQ